MKERERVCFNIESHMCFNRLLPCKCLSIFPTSFPIAVLYTKKSPSECRVEYRLTSYLCWMDVRWRLLACIRRKVLLIWCLRVAGQQAVSSTWESSCVWSSNPVRKHSPYISISIIYKYKHKHKEESKEQQGKRDKKCLISLYLFKQEASAGPCNLCKPSHTVDL